MTCCSSAWESKSPSRSSGSWRPPQEGETTSWRTLEKQRDQNLLEAAAEGDTPTVLVLLAAGADVNAIGSVDRKGSSAPCCQHLGVDRP